LRRPWVAQAWPKGGPRATQTQSQTGRGSQRLANYQIPRTKYPDFLLTGCFQRSWSFRTLRRWQSIAACSKRIKCESGHSKNDPLGRDQPFVWPCPQYALYAASIFGSLCGYGAFNQGSFSLDAACPPVALSAARPSLVRQ
jgi:hypothetical protein